jgi:hypothetical protein
LLKCALGSYKGTEVLTRCMRYAVGEFEVAEESQRFLRSGRGELEVSEMCSLLRCALSSYEVVKVCPGWTKSVLEGPEICPR